MYRRFVSLLLLPCMLLAQSASLGHAHGSNQPSDHNLRPHIHTKLEQQVHSHSHSHGTGGHHHHHDYAVPTETVIPDQQSEPSPTHDSDAVYVSALDLIILQISPVLDEDQYSIFLSAVELAILASAFDCHRGTVAICSHPPPISVQHCARYIQLLTLII